MVKKDVFLRRTNIKKIINVGGFSHEIFCICWYLCFTFDLFVDICGQSASISYEASQQRHSNCRPDDQQRDRSVSYKIGNVCYCLDNSSRRVRFSGKKVCSALTDTTGPRCLAQMNCLVFFKVGPNRSFIFLKKQNIQYDLY